MDKEEARQILRSEVAELRSSPYKQLCELIRDPKILCIEAPSGVEYQLEVQAFWDHPKKKEDNLRVIASIDDGGFFSALIPMSLDFIMAPDGQLIGEDDLHS